MATPTPTAALPEWLDTPPENSYSLMMFDHDDSGEQTIEMSREEFIKLKHHLATLRGYSINCTAIARESLSEVRAQLERESTRLNQAFQQLRELEDQTAVSSKKQNGLALMPSRETLGPDTHD